MQTYAAIHTAQPERQNDHEASYKGYKRIPVNFKIGAPFIRILWDRVEEDSCFVGTHASIGTTSGDNGEIFLAMPFLPHIPLVVMNEDKVPQLIIMYPENLPDVAKITHQMVLAGKLHPADLDAPFFEYLNQEFIRVGIPIFKIVRAGAANWDAKMSLMKSMNEISKTH